MKSLCCALLGLLFLPAAVSGSAPSRTVTRSTRVLPFGHDYAKAVAEAKARKVPIFVEAWAPW